MSAFLFAERLVPIGRAVGREGGCFVRACLRLHREGIDDIWSFPLFCPWGLTRTAAFSLVQEAAFAPHNVWRQASMELDTDQGRRHGRRI